MDVMAGEPADRERGRKEEEEEEKEATEALEMLEMLRTGEGDGSDAGGGVEARGVGGVGLFLLMERGAMLTLRAGGLLAERGNGVAGRVRKGRMVRWDG